MLSVNYSNGALDFSSKMKLYGEKSNFIVFYNSCLYTQRTTNYINIRTVLTTEIVE